MPKFEIIGPDPDGDWYVERIELRGTVTNHSVLMEAYPTEKKAQSAADSYNADPDSAPTA